MKSAETLKGCAVDDPARTVGGRPRADAVAHAHVEAVRPLTNKASATSDSLSFGACSR
jgi:hypothetical protein